LKNHLLSLLVALGLIASAAAQVPSADLANGLVGFYSFNGNANDSSGNNNNGVASNLTYGVDRFGNPNQSANFSNNGYVDIPGLGSLKNYPSTFSMWLDLNSYRQNSWGQVDLIGKEVPGQGNMYILDIYNNWNDNIHNQLYISGFGTSYTPPLDTWINLVLTYDINRFATLYVNGSSVFSTTLNSGYDYLFTDQTFQISKSYTYDQVLRESIPGNVSDVGVWNTALSSSQVSSLYALQSVPEPSTYALFGIGAIGMLMVMRRQKTA